MLRNADISYSSITPNQPCCKCCLLRIPYGTMTATLLSVCGLIITVTSLMQSTMILDKVLLDLFSRKYYWFNDLKVIFVIGTIIVSIFVLINLMIGFATTGRSTGSTTPKGGQCCSCVRGSATGCLIKTTFVMNYLLYFILFICSLLVVIALFITFVVSSLCRNQPQTANQANGRIDLRQFTNLVGLPSNETDLLYFEGNRLKMLCTDYFSSLTIYVAFCAFGFILLCWGFMNYLINLSVNWARLSTKQKCAELMYINSAEMTAFGDRPLENGSRY